jgi:hypothetical protein
MDASHMVIVRSRNRGIMAFSLTPSTRWEGIAAVGATVSIRYREDGPSHVAAAVTLQRRDP